MREAGARTFSKADLIRQRREERGQPRPSRAAKRAAYAAVLPSVVARDGIGTPIAKRTTNKRPKRKVVIPLGSPGAEMHMPAIPALHPGWRLFSGLTVFWLTGVLLLLMNAPFLKIEGAVIKGNERLAAADLAAVGGMAGLPVVQFDPAEAKMELQTAFPELQSIDIKVQFPARILIAIEEREPMVEWRFEEQAWWIDAEGVIFRPRGEVSGLLAVRANMAPPVMPTINLLEEILPGDSEGIKAVDEPVVEKINGELLQTVLHLGGIVPAGTTLVYDTVQGLGWIDQEGWRVYVGMWLDDLDTKIEVYEAVIDHLNQQGIRPAMVSVAQVNAPFYRMEQ